MCLMLYLSSNSPIELTPPDGDEPCVLSVSTLPDGIEIVPVDGRFTYLIGSHLGCGCGFPHVIAQEPIPFHEGVFDGNEYRDRDLQSVSSLLALVDSILANDSVCYLYPVCSGNEHLPPLGTVDWDRNGIDPEQLLFTEQFIYKVHR
jgi:hypothetical protein